MVSFDILREEETWLAIWDVSSAYNQIEFTKDFILAKIAKGKTNGKKNTVFIWSCLNWDCARLGRSSWLLAKRRRKVKNCPNCQLNYKAWPENNVRNGNADTGPIKVEKPKTATTWAQLKLHFPGRWSGVVWCGDNSWAVAKVASKTEEREKAHFRMRNRGKMDGKWGKSHELAENEKVAAEAPALGAGFPRWWHTQIQKKKRTKESTRKLVKTFFSVCFPTFGRFCAARPHKTCHSWPQIQLTFICENIAAVLGVLAHPTPLSHSTDPILLWSSFSRSVFYFATHSYTHACTDGIFNFHCRSKLLLKWHFKNLIASSAPPTTQGWKMPSSSVWESCPLEQLLRQIASHRLHKEKNFQ